MIKLWKNLWSLHVRLYRVRYVIYINVNVRY